MSDAAITTPKFYNTLGRRLESFTPLNAGKVGVYTCGPTVYSDPHIGNLRAFVFEDVLVRALRYLGYTVTQVMNITDVDDKTIREANAAGLDLDTYTQPYIDSFLADLDILHVRRADEYPRATRHIGEMITMIEQLVANGHGYQAEDGSVYFRIASDEDYGRLSGFKLDEAQQGERVASDEYEKEDVRDFVLWKAAKPGEPTWDSPWGAGRPGWHIECSAMSMKYLGESFDIHCGGVDNIFPHHENEIAQSESATGKPFAHTWLHAEHLIVDGEKMSKSLGNQYTLSELIEQGIPPRILRYFYLSAHYRQKLNYTADAVESAAGALRRIDQMRFRLDHTQEQGPPNVKLAAAIKQLRAEFRAGLADDLNLSECLAALFGFVKIVNVQIENLRLGEGDQWAIRQVLGEVDQVLGVLDPADWKQDEAAPAITDEEIDELIGQRREARSNRDFAEADRLRGVLEGHGIVIEDTAQGTRWKRG